MIAASVHGFESYSSVATAERQVKTGPGTSLLMCILLIASHSPVFAQQWVPQGPGPITQGQVENVANLEVVGAINAVAPHPGDTNTVYVGGVNGGLWRTRNALAASPNWVPLFDAGESLSIGALEFDPTDASDQTLVAGTGRFSSFFDGGGRTGLLRTTDGGASWTVMDGGGTLDGLNVSGVAARGATLVLSANAADNPANVGVWRSTDGGATWTQMSGGAGTGLPAGAAFDLVGDPSNNARLFTNAGSNGVYRSDDTGATWTKVSDAAMDALIAAAANIEIAVGTSNNVYAAIVTGGRLAGLFRSANGSAPWTALDLPTTNENGVAVGIHPGSQGFIHLSIAADPVNANVVYVGGDRQPYLNEFTNPALCCFPPPNSIGALDFSGRLFRVDASQPTGSQFAHLTHSNTLGLAGGGTANSSSPHADSRDMAFAANGDLIEVDDGGIYRRTNPQTNAGDWFSMNGDIGTTEFHGVAWDSNADIVIGGAQDTGTPEQLLPANLPYQSVQTADGGDVAVDDTGTPGLSIRYSSRQRLGGFRRETYDAANNFVSRVLPGLLGVPALQPQFYTPIELNNVNPNRLIIGAFNGVYESLDQGANVTRISVIRINGGGLDPIAYGAAGNPDMLYVGSGVQVFVRTTAAGALTASATYPGTGIVADIVIDPDDPQTAFVIDNANVYRTTNAGASWTDITRNLQALDPGRLLSIAFSTSGPGSVIVGGMKGVFIASGSVFTIWTRLGDGLPRAPVYDLEYDAADDIVLAGTLGRGAWTLNLAPQGMRPALSLHAGVALPFGTLNATNNAGPTINLDLIVPLAPQIAADFRLGYSLFVGSGGAADVDILNLSANLKLIPVLTTPWVFVNGGFGAYYVDWSDLEAGFNLGVGVGQPLGPTLDLEASLNYHRTFTATPDLEFAKIQLGLIWAF